MDLNEQNMKQAYCDVLACTGMGGAESDCEGLMEKPLRQVVPEAMWSDFPARVLACAIRICTNEPYVWTVQNDEPVIGDEDVCSTLRDTWFVRIVRN